MHFSLMREGKDKLQPEHSSRSSSKPYTSSSTTSVPATRFGLWPFQTPEQQPRDPSRFRCRPRRLSFAGFGSTIN